MLWDPTFPVQWVAGVVSSGLVHKAGADFHPLLWLRMCVVLFLYSSIFLHSMVLNPNCTDLKSNLLIDGHGFFF